MLGPVTDLLHLNVFTFQAVKQKLVRRELRWNLVFTDYQESNFDLSQIILPTMILNIDEIECCRLSMREECECPADFKVPIFFY